METIGNGLTTAYAFLALVPILPFAGFWLFFSFLYQNRKKAITAAMDGTTFFLVGAVSGMMDTVLQWSFGGFWLILLVMLLGAGFIGNAQHRLKGHIDGRRIFLAVWRMSFFVLGALYVIFLVAGIIRKAWTL